MSDEPDQMIAGPTENGELLFWSNDLGWVDHESADTWPDRGSNLPVGGRWVDAKFNPTRNKLNELSAREWMPETVSVWRQKGLGKGHPDAQIERQHPAPFSFTDVARLVRFFTKPGQTVLDPFVGIGSTLKAAAVEGRRGIGIELNPTFVELARQRLATEVADADEQCVIEGDCRAILPTLDPVELVVTSPPYWNILSKKDHKAKQEREAHDLATDYGDNPLDLGTIESYDDYLTAVVGMAGECRIVDRGHLCMIVGDFRHGGRYYMLHADLANRIEAETELVLKGITVIWQPSKRVFPYGYPAAFVPNIHHQYVLIFRREADDE